MTKAVFIHSKELDNNLYPETCPFSTGRAGITKKILLSMDLVGEEFSPERATRAQIEQFHTSVYVDTLIQASKGHFEPAFLGMGLGTGDCPIFPEIYNYGLLSSGATLGAANLINDNIAKITFNPSGGLHHAAPDRASGFCYINDVVLGCQALTQSGKKVFYIDLDAHHGDGVQNAFYDRDDVLTLSFHQDPMTLFPGTGFEHEIGVGQGKGYSVNVPLPEGTFDKPYVRAFQEIAVPLFEAFQPDVLVVEFGMDSLAGDPLTHLMLTNNAHAKITEALVSFDKPILAVGGGGYNIDNTTRAWALIWSILSGNAPDADMSLGLGGVMLESTEWHAGLRDRVQSPSAEQKHWVNSKIDNTLEGVKKHVFGIHGI